MKLVDEKMELLRKEGIAKIKLACGISPEEKVLFCESAKTDGKYLIIEVKRKDGKTFSKGDQSRLSINGNFANSKGDTVIYKIKLNKETA